MTDSKMRVIKDINIYVLIVLQSTCASHLWYVVFLRLSCHLISPHIYLCLKKGQPYLNLSRIQKYKSEGDPILHIPRLVCQCESPHFQFHLSVT